MKKKRKKKKSQKQQLLIRKLLYLRLDCITYAELWKLYTD